MQRAAIVAPVRTPIGRFLGTLKDLPAERLATHAVAAVVERSGIDPGRIDDVIFAQGYASGEAPCIGRWAALAAGLPIEVPGMQIDRRCGGGLQAILNAVMMVQSGMAEVVLAGGAESMSNVEHYTAAMRGGTRAGNVQLYDRLDRSRERSQPAERCGQISGMIETAENVARDCDISRTAADEYALESHRRSAAAWEAGRFQAEVVPVPLPQRSGPAIAFSRDEGVRADTTLEKLASLKPMMREGVVTAGNASQQSDAAAACLVVAEHALAKLNLEPMAYFVAGTVVGCDPSRMGLGPVSAVQRLFARTQLHWDQIDLIELNEAFAAQVLGVLKGWGFDDPSRINVNGSGISLGHPIGATGARILATLLHELHRRRGRYGLETMCIGGGQGIAAVFERA